MDESAHIKRNRVNSSPRQLPGQIIPIFTCPVELMQQYAGAWLRRGKVSCLKQGGAIRSFQFKYARLLRLRRAWRRDKQLSRQCSDNQFRPGPPEEFF